MEFNEAERKLELFEIPDGKDEAAKDVRAVLAQMLVSCALYLGELQTARDIVGRRPEAGTYAYLFLAGMFVSLRDGNTAFSLSRVDNNGGKLLVAACRRNADEEDKAILDACEKKVAGMWPAAVAAAEALKGDVVKQDANGLWYFARHGDAVAQVSKMIGERLKESGESLSNEELQAVVKYRRSKDADECYLLGPEQQDAVRAAVEHNLTVITGGPGTGKTTIVCSILRALIKKGGLEVADIVLAAPTGRAGQRMGEALKKQCETALGDDTQACREIGKLTGMTVHSLLGGYGPNWKYNAENPLPHRLVVVDECSMVDLLLMRSLLAALRKDCRLVLLGDKNQLPSVEAGAVLGDLMLMGKNGHEAAFPELTESHRFAGWLKDCAEGFNAGNSNAIMSLESRLPFPGETWTQTISKPESKNGCFWYELKGEGLPKKVDGLLHEWAVAHGLGKDGALVAAARAIKDGDFAFGGKCSDAAHKLFEVLDASRILTVVRKGPFGVQHVNELLLKERLGRNPVQPLIDCGIPVIVTVNTRSLNLFNGDVGVTVKTRERGVCVLFPRGEDVVCCPVSKLPEHELAYAITVHKSQGSEFGNVLVVLPDDERHPLLNRQLVYTGITRAKERAVILGTSAALEHAIETKVERDTGIRAVD